MPKQNRYCSWCMCWVTVEDDLEWNLHKDKCLIDSFNPTLRIYDWAKEDM